MLLKHGGDHETRLRAIEKQWWRVGGAGAVLSVHRNLLRQKARAVVIAWEALPVIFLALAIVLVPIAGDRP